MATLGSGSLGGLVLKKVKGANGSGARSSDIVEGTGWGRVFDLVDEVRNEH